MSNCSEGALIRVVPRISYHPAVADAGSGRDFDRAGLRGPVGGGSRSEVTKSMPIVRFVLTERDLVNWRVKVAGVLLLCRIS